jgi:hypothetical protein
MPHNIAPASPRATGEDKVGSSKKRAEVGFTNRGQGREGGRVALRVQQQAL